MDKTRPDDSALIDDAEELPTPSQGGASGGDMAREVGQRDELKSLSGDDRQPTRVNARDKPEDGDMPTPPQRHK